MDRNSLTNNYHGANQREPRFWEQVAPKRWRDKLAKIIFFFSFFSKGTSSVPQNPKIKNKKRVDILPPNNMYNQLDNIKSHHSTTVLCTLTGKQYY